MSETVNTIIESWKKDGNLLGAILAQDDPACNVIKNSFEGVVLSQEYTIPKDEVTDGLLHQAEEYAERTTGKKLIHARHLIAAMLVRKGI